RADQEIRSRRSLRAAAITQPVTAARRMDGDRAAEGERARAHAADGLRRAPSGPADQAVAPAAAAREQRRDQERAAALGLTARPGRPPAPATTSERRP